MRYLSKVRSSEVCFFYFSFFLSFFFVGGGGLWNLNNCCLLRIALFNNVPL